MSSDKRSYHHGHLRAALLDTALEQTRTGGPTALGLREATRQVGVSPTAAYRHFADRQSLLMAVAREVQERMAARMRERFEQAPAGTGIQRARQRLRAVGLGYIDFARAEPGWFETAFFTGPEGPDAEPSPDEVAMAPPFRMLVEALDELIAAGALDASRREPALWACWSAVHGFSELAVHGPLRHRGADEVTALAAQTVDAIMTGVMATGSS